MMVVGAIGFYLGIDTPPMPPQQQAASARAPIDQAKFVKRGRHVSGDADRLRLGLRHRLARNAGDFLDRRYHVRLDGRRGDADHRRRDRQHARGVMSGHLSGSMSVANSLLRCRPRERGSITTGGSCCARWSLRLPSRHNTPVVMGPGSALASRGACGRVARLSGTTAVAFSEFEFQTAKRVSRPQSRDAIASELSIIRVPSKRRGRRECRVKASPMAPVQ